MTMDFRRQLREQELSPLHGRIRDLEEQCAALQAERKRAQPLVQAARQCVNSITDKDSLLRAVGPLIDAVDAYDASLSPLLKPSERGKK